MKAFSKKAGLLALAACVAGPAWGVEAVEVGERIDFNVETMPVGVEVRGGVAAFTGDLADRTSAGPSWGVAATAQPWSFLGAEVALEGARLPVDDVRVTDGEGIWRHGLSALAKVGPEINNQLRPYVGAGLGVSYVNPSEDAESFYDNDFVAELPLAAGVDYKLGAVTAGARASYKALWGEEFAPVPTAPGDDLQGGLFNFAVSLGGRF